MLRHALVIVLNVVYACGATDTEAPATPAGIAVVPVVSGLSSPLFLTAPANDGRLFIVEQRGTIRVVKNGQLVERPFLDLRGQITSAGERGLLGLAFHPKYATNGFFYVDYTDLAGNTRVVRFHAAPGADTSDATAGTVILAVPQPFANHNGGMLQFGADGMLYIGMGDGGSGGDPQGNGQRLNTLLGKILRIDVDRGSPYAIPPDNPFVGRGDARGEIWAYGLRNPWRFAFDREAAELYIADVGQNAWEEVNVVPATRSGMNYGWNIEEGNHCYGSRSCNTAGLQPPALEYGHADGCSITGGFVYRGRAIPAARGLYFYSDYCTGFLRSFRNANGIATERHDWRVTSLGSVLSFGEDATKELYVLSANGTVYRLTGS
jgi:glucose/arabinose dehydrogenase